LKRKDLAQQVNASMAQNAVTLLFCNDAQYVIDKMMNSFVHFAYLFIIHLCNSKKGGINKYWVKKCN